MAMRILLTNDDGYDAPGLAALYRAATSLRDAQIEVIAPASVQSGVGHAVSDTFTCRQTSTDIIGEVTAVEGTPADCVRAALAMDDAESIQWVIAGINQGGNLGVDIHYSGTVAAAREAAIGTRPAIAVSHLVRTNEPVDWNRATRWTAAILAALIQPDEPADADPDVLGHPNDDASAAAPDLRTDPNDARASRPDLQAAADPDIYTAAREAYRAWRSAHPAQTAPPAWNVNLPCLPEGESPTGVAFVDISPDTLPIVYERETHDSHTHTWRYAGDYHARIARAGTDVAAAFAGQIAISPLPIV